MSVCVRACRDDKKKKARALHLTIPPTAGCWTCITNTRRRVFFLLFCYCFRVKSRRSTDAEQERKKYPLDNCIVIIDVCVCMTAVTSKEKNCIFLIFIDDDDQENNKQCARVYVYKCVYK